MNQTSHHLQTHTTVEQDEPPSHPPHQSNQKINTNPKQPLHLQSETTTTTSNTITDLCWLVRHERKREFRELLKKKKKKLALARNMSRLLWRWLFIFKIFWLVYCDWCKVFLWVSSYIFIIKLVWQAWCECFKLDRFVLTRVKFLFVVKFDVS